MKYAAQLSILASLLIWNVSAADELSDIITAGKISGQIRMFYIDRDYSGTTTTHRNGTSIGGYLKLESGAFYGLSAGLAGYTTNRIFQGLEINTYDPTLFGPDGASYCILGEAYLQYTIGKTNIKGGRQKLDTPMAGSDDARMIPSLFEAYVLKNDDIKNLSLSAGHMSRFAPGTFANAYNGGILGETSGYTGVSGNTAKYQEDFANMGDWAFGKDSSGVSFVSASYSGIKGLSMQLWDYYAYDYMNIVYAEANYNWLFTEPITPYISLQYIREDNTGSDYMGQIGSDFTGVKAGIKVADFDIYGAYSYNSKDGNAAANGGTISPWGGMPAFTQGMVIRHQFMAGTDTWKASGNYNWKKFGINLNTDIYYASFNMDELNGYSPGYSWTATEAGLDVIYFPELLNGPQLRFRANFPRNFKETASSDTNWDEYRFIVNYNF